MAKSIVSGFVQYKHKKDLIKSLRYLDQYGFLGGVECTEDTLIFPADEYEDMDYHLRKIMAISVNSRIFVGQYEGNQKAYSITGLNLVKTDLLNEVKELINRENPGHDFTKDIMIEMSKSYSIIVFSPHPSENQS